MDKQKIIILILAVIIIITFSNCAPAVVEEKEKKIDYVANPTEQYFIFVDINNGTNGAAGTKTAPVDDIKEGINLAQSAGKDVCVAEGTYDVDSSIVSPTNIIMNEGVSIYGGYHNAGGVWTRNTETYLSIIKDLTSTARGYMLSAVTCNPSITRATIINGLKITSGYGAITSAIYCNGGSPSILNNEICGYSGANSGDQTYGIYCNSGSPLIKNNVIYGGSKHDATTGIYLEESMNVNIHENEIYGNIPESPASTSESCGILCKDSDAIINGNDINGGDNATKSFGMSLNNSQADINNNKINGGENSSGMSIGINCYDMSNPSIENNEINGGTCSGIFISGIVCDSESNPDIAGNTIFCGGNALRKFAIYTVQSSNPRISKNQITITGDLSISILLKENSCPEIIWNIFSCGSGSFKYAIVEDNNASEPVSVADNSFSTAFNISTNSYLYRDYSGDAEHLISTIDDLNNMDDSGYNPAGSVSGNKYIK